MKTEESKSASNDFDLSKWMGAALCVLLFVLAIAKGARLISVFLEQALSLLFILVAVVWCVKKSEKLLRLSELYVWLAFILSVNHLQILAHGLAEQLGLDDIAVFRVVAIIHVLVVVAALWVLKAWSRQGDGDSYPARFTAGLFIVGAVVFWVGARTFPGLTLGQVQANLAGHLWTSINFLLATIITLAGLALFTLALREAGDRFLSVFGLLAFMFGAVFWTLHLAFRLTVLVQAAQEWNQTSIAPLWFEPWRQWAALLFGIYSVLAYLGLAAYGGALLKMGWLPRWVGWICIVAGLIAAPLGGLPLFIHVPLWLVGIFLLRQRRPWQQEEPSDKR